MAKYFEGWAEIWFFIVIAIGFLISITIDSKVLVYFTIFLTGAMAGRLIFERKQKLSFPYYLIVIGFLIGYLIGSRFGDRRIMIVLFIFGTVLSYYAHDKGIIRDIRY